MKTRLDADAYTGFAKFRASSANANPLFLIASTGRDLVWMIAERVRLDYRLLVWIGRPWRTEVGTVASLGNQTVVSSP